jgi:hypothetical protein
MIISYNICKPVKLRVFLNRNGNFGNGFLNKIEMKTSYLKVIFLTLAYILVFSFGSAIAWAYGLTGYRWGGTSATYNINNAFADSFRAAFWSSAGAWNTAGSRFRFNYGNITTRNPNIYIGYISDGYSDIGHVNAGDTAGRIAKSNGWLSGNTFTESDTTFNTYYPFTTVGTPNSNDVQDIMTHEFGHWLRLNDVYAHRTQPSYCDYSYEATMCGYFVNNETNKRSLESDDTDGIKAIYGI